MAPRANWKGYLKLSLVSCAVALFPATSRSGRIRFNILNRETGHRVRYEVVDAETGEEVADEDRVKGYKIGDDDYVLVEDEDFDKVALESTHTIDIDAFVARKDVDPLYLDESYYIVPDDKVGVEAFAVIREAMRKKGLAGLARVVLHRREQLLLLEPREKGIMATGLRYHDEVRKEEDYFDDIPAVKVADDMLDLAEHILQTKRTKFDPAKFEDRYEAALAEMISAKQAGKPPPSAPPPTGGNVINLMDALRRSVKQEQGGKAAGGSTGKSARRTGSKAGKATRGKSARSKASRAKASRAKAAPRKRTPKRKAMKKAS